jgi:hypothetical protein
MTFLKKLWHGWLRFGQFMGDILARVVLTLFYFTLFVPFGLGVTLLSDPLNVRKGGTQTWLPREAQDEQPSLADAGRQF